MIEVATGLFVERVDEEPAVRVPGHDDAPNRLEVLPRFFVAPDGAPG
jgi:hypothetical protein